MQPDWRPDLRMDDSLAAFLDADVPDSVHAVALRRLAEQRPDLLTLLLHPAVSAALTSSDERLRYRGALLVAELVDAGGSDLSPAATHALVEFFCSRIADQPSVVPCLIALKALLLKSASMAEHDVQLAVRTIYSALPVQSLAQSIRQRVYELSIALLKSDRVAAFTASMGEVVTQGMLAAVHGERDPRCLLLCFQVLDLLPRRYERSLSESLRIELFEASACYFPITFEPPADDPHGVTAEALIAGLLQSLTSHPALLNYTPSFLMDQLSEDSLVAGKLQAMDGLIRVAQLHSPSSLRMLLPDLAGHLQSMVGASQSATRSKALSAITEICRCIKDDGCWRDFGEVLLSKLSLELAQGLDNVQATTAVIVAKAIAESSFDACVGVFHRILPILSKKMHSSVEAVRFSLNSTLTNKTPYMGVEPSVNCYRFISLLAKSVESGITYTTAPVEFKIMSPIIESLSKLLSVVAVEGRIDFKGVMLRDVKVYVSAIECLGGVLGR